MSLAATLSKDEVQRTLKVAMKKTKKNAPPPKYLCMPSSHQIQQRVVALDSTQPVCDTLQKLITAHGTIPELRTLTVKSMKTIYTGQLGTDVNLRLPTIRRFVERYLKTKFLEHPGHRNFWSYVVIGVNNVIKHLERLQTSEAAGQAVEQVSPSLCCIILDAGWLASQLGHHIAHLCALRDVRLISFRPVQSLAKLISTDLYTVKKAIALGICLSNTAPSELVAWMEQVRSIVPRLVLPKVLSMAKTAAMRAAPEAQLDGSGAARKTDSVEPTTWDRYTIDREKLYLYGTESPVEKYLPAERVITLSDLWRQISMTPQRIEEHPTVRTTDMELTLALYEQAQVRTVPPQTEDQRQSKKLKNKKNKKRSKSQDPTSESPKKKKRKKMQPDN